MTKLDDLRSSLTNKDKDKGDVIVQKGSTVTLWTDPFIQGDETNRAKKKMRKGLQSKQNKTIKKTRKKL